MFRMRGFALILSAVVVTTPMVSPVFAGVPRNMDLDGLVYHDYQCILGRGRSNVSVSLEEKSWWRGQVAARIRTSSEVMKDFFASDEYKNKRTSNGQYASDLYRCVLFRGENDAPDAESIAYWAGEIARTSRSKVLETFLQSLEFQNQVLPALNWIAFDARRQTLGVTHVAGDYRFTKNSANFLREGAEYIKDVGSESIFVYLTGYACLNPAWGGYPGTDFGNPKNIADMANSKSYRELFAMPIKNFVLTTFTCATARLSWTPPAGEFTPVMAEGEKQEIYLLTKYLLLTYQGTGKRFVITNGEGDTWMTGGTFGDNLIPLPEQIERMKLWLRARYDGVRAAREELRDLEGVSVEFAIEIVRLDWARKNIFSMLRDVVPFVESDLVAYSAWETVNGWGTDPPVWVPTEKLRERILADIYFLRKFPGVGEREILIAEYGFPETLYSDSGERTKIAANAFLESGVPFAFYWEILDNECERNQPEDPGQCPGFGLIRKDFSRAPAWYALRSVLGMENDAEFIGELPQYFVAEAGKQYQVSLTFRNIGDVAWDAANGYRLGAWNPYDNWYWGIGRVGLEPGESIAPGEQKIFSFSVTAPMKPGMYNFQWRMVEEWAEWFGDPSPSVTVEVK